MKFQEKKTINLVLESLFDTYSKRVTDVTKITQAMVSNNIISNEDFTKQIMQLSDTLSTTTKGVIRDVCSKKGCWMTLGLFGGEELMVRFKDYNFFVPLDASGQVIINGKAFISQTSVQDLKHYAEDSGLSKSEIESITKPKITYSFIAEGVILAD